MTHARLSEVVRHVRGLAEVPRPTEASDADLLERFVTRREESAFAGLLRRHGPLVWGVCRRALPQEQDAEDVYQATFLVLARKAASIRKRTSLGSWLHGVALRLAIRARAQGTRRQQRERQAAQMRTTRRDHPWSEVQTVLDTALAELPEKYRTALVLCCLEGRTHAEVAGLLRCPLATVRTRLARGRNLLRDRLARRGLTLSAAGVAALLLANASSTAGPAALSRTTLAAALSVAEGQTTASVCSARVAGLVQGGLKAMTVVKVQKAMVLLLAASLLAGASVWVGHCLRAAEQPRPGTAPEKTNPPAQAAAAAPAPQSPATRSQTAETLAVRGRVLDPDGKPFVGAKLYLKYDYRPDQQLPLRATTGPDGRFTLSFARSLFQSTRPGEVWFQVIAVAPGYGPDWVYQEKPEAVTDVTLRLVRDLPIRGRILTLDGRPVRGATLRLGGTSAYVNLDAFLRTVRDREWPLVNGKEWGGPFPGQPRVLTTDAEGRFVLTGAGRDRVVEFELEGPGIQYGPVRALARELKAPVEPRRLKYPETGPNITRVYGATFDHAALPSRPIRGVVRDKRNGLPVAGVELSAFRTTHKTHSDRAGHYELLGCPKDAEGYSVTVWPAGQLYFARSIHFPDTPGLAPLQADIELVSGLRVEGRVTHRETGKPLAGVRVEYNPLYPNPFVRWFGANGAGMSPCSFADTGPDGTYRIVVLPGPGVLAFRAQSRPEGFVPAMITPQELKAFFHDDDFHGREDMLRVQAGINSWTAMSQSYYHRLLLIKPDEKDGSLTRDVALRPARPLRGQIVAASGKLPSKLRAYNVTPGYVFRLVTDGSFTVDALDPRRPRHLAFVDPDRQYGAFVTLRGEQKAPLTVRLQPCGSVTGRLLDADGEPVKGAVVRLESDELRDCVPAYVKTDNVGRFRIDGLIPGQKHQARLGLPPFGQYLFRPFTVEPGQGKDLGDVRVRATR